MLDKLKSEVKGLSQCALVPRRAKATGLWSGIGLATTIAGALLKTNKSTEPASPYILYPGIGLLSYGGYKYIRTAQAYMNCKKSTKGLVSKAKKLYGGK